MEHEATCWEHPSYDFFFRAGRGGSCSISSSYTNLVTTIRSRSSMGRGSVAFGTLPKGSSTVACVSASLNKQLFLAGPFLIVSTLGTSITGGAFTSSVINTVCTSARFHFTDFVTLVGSRRLGFGGRSGDS